ncbi:MAG TPA: hypothetical protein VI072_31835 [Polyangiaceae bacterium]
MPLVLMFLDSSMSAPDRLGEANMQRIRDAGGVVADVPYFWPFDNTAEVVDEIVGCVHRAVRVDARRVHVAGYYRGTAPATLFATTRPYVASVAFQRGGAPGGYELPSDNKFAALVTYHMFLNHQTDIITSPALGIDAGPRRFRAASGAVARSGLRLPVLGNLPELKLSESAAPNPLAHRHVAGILGQLVVSDVLEEPR